MNPNQISFYVNARDNKGSATSVPDAINLIMGTGLTDTTFYYRTLTPKEQEKKKIKIFPAVTWMGKFALATVIKADYREDFLKGKFCWKDLKGTSKIYERTRAIEQLETHSEFHIIDIDKLTQEQHDSLKKLLRHDPYIFFMFTSPSGIGLKLLFKTSSDETQHLAYFLAIEKYMLQEYKLPVDPSGKDVSRLCFLCADSNSHYNNDAVVFPLAFASDAAHENEQEQKATAKLDKKAASFKQSKTFFETLHEQFDYIIKWVERNEVYEAGIVNNNYIYLLSCAANRLGISQSDTENYIENNYTEWKEDSIKKTIKSAYQNHLKEYGTFARNRNDNNVQANKTKQPGKANSKALPKTNKAIAGTQSGTNTKENVQADVQTQAADDTDEFIQFWFITTKTDRETGEVKTTYNIDYLKFIEFLKQQGFARYRLNDGYQFIRIINRKIAVIKPDDIKDFVLEFCYDRQLWDVYKMLLRGNKSYLGTDKFQALPYLFINIKKDTKDECYLYFDNVIVTICKDDIHTATYSELSQEIWDGQVNKHKFSLQQTEYIDESYFNKPEEWKCEFAKFVYYTSYNPNNDEEKELPLLERMQRFCSFATSIGFLLHSYKHPAYRKGIFAIDHKISDKFESHGRTGKSIIPTACTYLKVVSTIPGKQYDPQYQFRYEPINIDTQIINFNDMKRTHDVENEFEIIADNYSINKRNTGFLFFKYAESAKVYYSTNHIPKGDGESYKGRMHIIEFSDFFNASFTPFDYFKHSLFDDWDEAQWNEFYNFMCFCIQLYLIEGLMPYPNGNFNIRKLIADCPQEFIDWCDTTEKVYPDETPEEKRLYKNLPRNKKLEKKPLFKEWQNSAKEWGMTNLTPHSFTKWVKNYCKTRGLEWISKKPGGTEYYYIFTKDANKAAIINQLTIFDTTVFDKEVK